MAKLRWIPDEGQRPKLVIILRKRVAQMCFIIKTSTSHMKKLSLDKSQEAFGRLSHERFSPTPHSSVRYYIFMDCLLKIIEKMLLP